MLCTILSVAHTMSNQSFAFPWIASFIFPGPKPRRYVMASFIMRVLPRSQIGKSTNALQAHGPVNEKFYNVVRKNIMHGLETLSRCPRGVIGRGTTI